MRQETWDSEACFGLTGFTCCARYSDNGDIDLAFVDYDQARFVPESLQDVIDAWWGDNAEAYLAKRLDEQNPKADREDEEYHRRVEDGK